MSPATASSDHLPWQSSIGSPHHGQHRIGVMPARTLLMQFAVNDQFHDPGDDGDDAAIAYHRQDAVRGFGDALRAKAEIPYHRGPSDHAAAGDDAQEKYRR